MKESFLLGLILLFLFSVVKCDIQLDALKNFYNTTNGNNWKDKTNWLADDNYCNWKGIACQGNDVVALELEGNGLVGNFILNDLNKLQTLKLKSNQLSGDLSSICGLASLVYVDVSNNVLKQELSKDCFSSSNLQTLLLNDNLLTGTVPSLKSWTQLQTLNLKDNKLTGFAQDNFNINVTSLTSCDLSINSFGCPIPTWAQSACSATCSSGILTPEKIILLAIVCSFLAIILGILAISGVVLLVRSLMEKKRERYSSI